MKNENQSAPYSPPQNVAVAYARFSSDNQRDESIDAQLRAIEEYAQKNNILLLENYIDRARSATTDERPEFQRMIRNAELGEFDTVIVHKLDRFSRNRYDSAYYKRQLQQHNIRLVSVVENIDGSPESILTESFIEGLAEYYSVNLAREVMKGLKENALRAMHTGGIPPLGFDIDPETKRYILNQRESLAVCDIFQGVLTGKGYRTIIHELNEAGYRTKTNKLFAKNSLYEILRNEKYRGAYIFNRSSSKELNSKRNNHKRKDDSDIIRIEGGVPRIISDEDFYAVQDILKSRQRRDSHRKAMENYLLSGKIRCGECGSSFCGNRKFSGRNKQPHITYRCNNRVGRTSTACSNKEINRDYLEKFVLQLLAETIFDEALIPQLASGYNEYIQKSTGGTLLHVNELKKNITKININIEKLVNVITETGNATLVQRLDAMEKEKFNLEKAVLEERSKLKTVEIPQEMIATVFHTAKQLFSSGQLEDMRQLINLFVEEIIVYKEHVEIRFNVLPFYHPSNMGDNPLPFQFKQEASRAQIYPHQKV